MGNVLPRLIGDAGGVLYVGMGSRAEGHLSLGLQGQGMSLGEGIGGRNHRKGSRLEGGAVIDLLAVIQLHRQGAGGDLQSAKGIARNVVIGGDVLAVPPEFHLQVVGGAAHVAAGGGIHRAVLVAHPVLHGNVGVGLVGAVIDQGAAFGMDNDRARSDGEGALLDEERVVVGLLHPSAVQHREGEDIGGGAHVQNGGGGLYLQMVADDEGRALIHEVLVVVQGVARIGEGAAARLHDEGAFLHRELTRLDRDIVKVGDLPSRGIEDAELGGIGLGARVNEGITEDRHQVVAVQERSACDLVAVVGQGDIVVDLGGVLHRHRQGAGAEADGHPFGIRHLIARETVIPLLIGDTEGGEVGVGGGGGGVRRREDHAAVGLISLGQSHGLDRGGISVGGGSVGNGQGQLAVVNLKGMGLGIGSASEGGLAVGADGIGAREDGLARQPAVASRGAVLVVGP